MTDTLTLSIGREMKVPKEGSTCSSDRYIEARSTSSMESSSGRLDWAATLSPIERSCIDLTIIEPCVNKAVANLESLKETLALKEKLEMEMVRSPSPTQRKRPSSVRMRKSEDSDLSVEGMKTGVMLEKYRRTSLAKKSMVSHGTAVLSSVLNIVARLEHDRQDTQVCLDQQQVKSHDLNSDLEREDEQRQDMLLEFVQAEHDRCARDIRELKWHINFEGRRLRRQLEYQTKLSKKNAELKREVSHLTEVNPQLEEKIRLEEGKIKDIIRLQGETVADLKAVEHDLQDLQEKCHQIHLVADAEVGRTEERRSELEEVLEAARAELEEISEESVAISKKIKTSTNKLSAVQKQSKNLNREIEKSELHQRLIKERVGKLERERHDLLQEKNEQKQLLEGETGAHEAECLLMEGAYSGRVSAMQKEARDLIKAKRDKESLEHDIDSIKEAIFKTKQKILDNEKSITRSYRDIERLDQQLEVSLIEYNHSYRSQRRVAEEYKLEKDRASSAEDSLNSMLDKLRKKVKEECKTQVLYENKSKAQTSNILKLAVEFDKKEERVLAIVTELEEQVNQKMEKVKELTEIHDAKVALLKLAQTELSEVKDESVALEKNLGAKQQELASVEGQLKEEMLVKVNDVETISEKIRELEAKLEDMEKSIASLTKLQKAASLALEQLTVERTELEARLTAELELQQSWKGEYQEIADFSTDADSKHSQYLEDRSKLLQQCKLDFAKSVTNNAELATTYYQLQCEFIDVKTQALKVIETKLKLETSLRDHQQLLTFQACMYSAMADHYHNRGVHCHQDLTQFHQKSEHNTHQLRNVRSQLETMLTLMLGFLSKGKKLQA